MRVIDAKQGSDDWLEARKLADFTASDAAAVINESKYQTRNEMIRAKATGETKTVSPHLQTLFNKGHAAEESARPLVEATYSCELYPVTMSTEINGLNLLASLDGVAYDDDTFDPNIIFEHKLLNKDLAEHVSNSIVPITHAPQLEFQLAVTGAKMVVFVASDGTKDSMVYCTYTSKPELWARILSAFKQAKIDIENYTPEPKKEVVIANEQSDLPALNCSVEGSLVVSNLAEYIPVIKELAREQMTVVLDADQDFADKEAFNKKVKSARATLKASASDIEARFTSLADFNGYVKEADSILQKLQSHGEKQVDESKKKKKESMLFEARIVVADFADALIDQLGGDYIQRPACTFSDVIKGKRNFESMKNAIDSEIAAQKIEMNKQADLIRINLSTLKELCGNYRHLFADHATLILKSNDDLVNSIKARISEHKREEEAKDERMREKIREEERVKAEAKVVEKTPEVTTFKEASTEKKPVQKAIKNTKQSSAPRIIKAIMEGDGAGYNLYLNDRKVGYLECGTLSIDDITIVTASC